MSAGICAALAAPFDSKLVSWRVGPTAKDKSKGMALAYIDARDVMRRLDDVCGPENWQDEYPWSDGKRVVCRIGIKILISEPANPDKQYEWVWKTDGAGDTDTEGEKGALSDAFKRAAVKWGIGRYLYDTDSPWVQIEKRGNSYIIPKAELDKLAVLLRRQFGGAEPPAGERNAAALPSQPAPNGNASVASFWTRNDYGINPEVIQGGLPAWDGEFLRAAENAPSLDALLKLKEDNRAHHKTWYKKAADPVREHFTTKFSAIERRLS